MKFVIISSAVVALTSGIMWPNWVNEIRAYYGKGKAGKCELPVFNLPDFDSAVSNPYLSMLNIGATYVYEAETDRGLVRKYIWFPSNFPEIMGVTCHAVIEKEYIWAEEIGEWKIIGTDRNEYAWDKYGNYWHFGENNLDTYYTDDWTEEGIYAYSYWTAGENGALPGIILLAEPKSGDCVQQEFYQNVERIAWDMGQVSGLKGDKSDHCNKNCLVIKE